MQFFKIFIARQFKHHNFQIAPLQLAVSICAICLISILDQTQRNLSIYLSRNAHFFCENIFSPPPFSGTLIYMYMYVYNFEVSSSLFCTVVALFCLSLELLRNTDYWPLSKVSFLSENQGSYRVNSVFS